MKFVTTCPPETYQKHISKCLERRVQRLFDESFYQDMKEVFNKGVPEGQVYSITGSPTMSKSSLYELQWLYYQPPVSEELLNTIKKRAFKVTYKGQLLTSDTRIFL